jgi:hypothetical protein
VLVNIIIIITDADIEVRKASLLMANAAAHHNSAVIAPFLRDQVIPELLSTMIFKQERVVDLGPFKHKVNSYIYKHKNIWLMIFYLSERFICVNICIYMKKYISISSLCK